jgi:hypothetical protein
MMKLVIDFEHTSRRWWDAGGKALWDAITDEPGAGKVVVDEDLAASWIAQAEAIPGWNDGPEYAPHPIALVHADEDDL